MINEPYVFQIMVKKDASGRRQWAIAVVIIFMKFYKTFKFQIIYFLVPICVCLAGIVLSYAGGEDVLMRNGKRDGTAVEKFSTPFTRVIVQLNIESLVEEHEEGEKQRLIAQVWEALIRDLGSTAYRVNRVYKTIPFVALEVSPAAFQALKKSTFVVGIEEDSLSLPPSQ
jgi:hypothetical protein